MVAVLVTCCTSTYLPTDAPDDRYIPASLEKPVAVEVRGTFVEIALGIDWAALALQRPSRAEEPDEW